jgi:Fic family protein
MSDGFIVIKERNGKKYHYLTKNIRISVKKWKKIQIYIGSGKLTKKQIENIKLKNKEKLNKLEKAIINRFKIKKFKFLSKKQVEKIEEVKENYQKRIKSRNKIALEKFKEYFVTEFTFNSNAIEGNTLKRREVDSILFDNRIPENASLREVYETRNSKDAIDFMSNYKGDVNHKFILKLHAIIMKDIDKDNAGKYRNRPEDDVYIRGSEHVPTKSVFVEKSMDVLLEWYRTKKYEFHPLELSSIFHQKFVYIHPFTDGNGRCSRLLLNFILLRNNLPHIIVKVSDRKKYFDAIHDGDLGDHKSLIRILYRYLIRV